MAGIEPGSAITERGVIGGFLKFLPSTKPHPLTALARMKRTTVLKPKHVGLGETAEMVEMKGSKTDVPLEERSKEVETKRYSATHPIHGDALDGDNTGDAMDILQSLTLRAGSGRLEVCAS